MKRLVKYELDLRYGSFEGVYVVDDELWNEVLKWTKEGREIYLGEICGKHSEVIVTADIEDFVVISEDQEFIDKFDEIIGGGFGDCIFDYMDLDEDNQEEEEEDDEDYE